MDEEARKAIIQMLEHDRRWAYEVFNPQMGLDARRLSCEKFPAVCTVPPPLAQLIIETVREEQVTDLTRAIEILRRPPSCISASLKRYMLTIIENDTHWFVSTNEYSRLTRPRELICDKILEAIEELKSIPECE